MRIHSDTLTRGQVLDAIGRAGATYETLEEKGSRSRKRAFEVKLFGESPHSTQSGNGKAASYDQWGLVLAALWEYDPEMRCPYYADKDTFHAIHFDRYRTLTFPYTHVRHNWEYVPSTSTHMCDCGAERDFSRSRLIVS